LTDVIVIGAGIIGAACAWRLAEAGFKVLLFDPNHGGSQSSLAALGMLSFHARVENPPVLHALATASRQYFPTILEELAEILGERVAYGRSGHLRVALRETDEQEIEAAAALNLQHDLAFERVDAAGCRELEPAVHPEARGGLLFLDDAWVDNRALTAGLVAAARRAGAEFKAASVDVIESTGGRVLGVRAGGELHPADWVILAAGCWSASIPGVPRLSIEPRRGQAFAVAGPVVRRIFSTPSVYLVPRSSGETLVGATVERVGFEIANTVAGIQEVMHAGQEALPALADCRFLRAWAGLRPGTPDGVPVIGAFAELPNLIAATGHFRDGILLAPLTAELVRQVVMSEKPQVELAPLSPDRPALTPAV
jgi:glycine oxidase